MPTIGEKAPDCRLKSHLGDEMCLSDFAGEKNVVLDFYPLDLSPVCSNQLPEYSGRQADFSAYDAVVIGVNRDSVYTHTAWAKEFGIDLPLLADMTGEAARAYGVYDASQGRSGRAVFIVDKAGVLRTQHIESSAGDFTFHADDIVEALKKL